MDNYWYSQAKKRDQQIKKTADLLGEIYYDDDDNKKPDRPDETTVN